jgi:hypothetical protein
MPKMEGNWRQGDIFSECGVFLWEDGGARLLVSQECEHLEELDRRLILFFASGKPYPLFQYFSQVPLGHCKQGSRCLGGEMARPRRDPRRNNESKYISINVLLQILCYNFYLYST